MQNAHAIPISPVTGPGAPAPSASPAPVRAPGQRFGRTALMIHMLALLCFAAAWTLMLVLGQYSPEGQAVQGVGGAAALTCAIWSGLLALRGIWRDEPVGVPLLVLVALGIEAAGPCLWLWLPLLEGYNPLTPMYEFSLWLGLPLFVPYFVFVSLIAVPLAWVVVRLIERWKRKPDEECWSRRRRLRGGLVAYLVIFGLSLATVFPYPLFAYAALEQSHRKYWTPPINWQAATLSVMPDYVRSGLDSFCSRNLPWRYVRHRVSLIEKGQLPRERLLAHMEDPWEEIQAAAWKTYFREHTEEAIALCEAEEKAAEGGRDTWSLWHARMSFRDWPVEQRMRWMALLLRGLEDPDLRVRRAAAHVSQSCISKPETLDVPWPWNKTQPAEQPAERASMEAVRQAALEWLATQQERLKK